MDDPGCECGEETEDIFHVLWECEKYEHLRDKLVQKLEEKGFRGRPQYQDLVRKDKPAICVAVARFLTETGRVI